MFTRSRSFFTFTATLLACLSSIAQADVANNWTNPNANLPSFSSTYLVGERIFLSWLSLNQSTNDLWLTRYDSSTDNFALRIASALDISVAGSFPWQIALAEEEVLQDTRFEFSFVAQDASYDAAAESNIVSPGFNLMMVNQATPPNGTVGSISSVAPSTTISGTSISVTSTSTAGAAVTSNTSLGDAPGSGISPGIAGGIAVAALAMVALAGFAVGYYVFKKRQSRHNKKQTISNPEVTLAGPYEILGDRRHPVEVGGKEAQAHEMMCSRETNAAGSDGGQVHEVGNTVKKPGLHEMPG